MFGLCWTLRAQERQFFRVICSNETRITRLDADGYLTWTNPCASGLCTVEMSQGLDSGTNWASYVRIPITSSVIRVRLFDPDPPQGMELIPGGVNCGTNPLAVLETYDSWYPREYSLSVRSIYMDRFEVTNEKLLDVYQWAYSRIPSLIQVSEGQVYNTEGKAKPLLNLSAAECRITFSGGKFALKAAKGAGYPCVWISWHGAAAYCNYLSRREGLGPCYSLADWSRIPSANGYRLPTSDEWEYAARSGLASRRFPWGDTISHTLANYKAEMAAQAPYDRSFPAGRHPDWNQGELPCTSPVGTFGPFGFGRGLCDMAGNVFEWCDDWLPGYEGRYRAIRSGSWDTAAGFCRTGWRFMREPISGFYTMGFRACRDARLP